MSSVETNAVLNRLSVIHSRSLPIYLSYAAPWAAESNGAADTLNAIVADQLRIADRIGEMILDSNGEVDPGAFPMRYTSLHDLSLNFLLNKLIEQQMRDILAIEQCSSQLATAPLAKAVAEEALGAAKGHLESLKELKHARHA